MIVKRVAPLSVAKVMGVLYAIGGLLVGALISVISIVGGAIGAGAGEGGNPFAMLFGAGAIIVLPIFYGVLGFIMTLIGAALYNFVASLVGGIEIEVEQVSRLS